MVNAWFGQAVAANWWFFAIGWVLALLLIFLPNAFRWLWAMIGWTVTTARSPSGSAEAAFRKVLAEQAAAQQTAIAAKPPGSA
jgi:hypothetical protein